MLITFAIIAFIIWITVQASADKPRAKWKRRFEPFAPVVRHVGADVRATRDWIHSFRVRDLFRPRWWRERLQFREVWRGWEKS